MFLDFIDIACVNSFILYNIFVDSQGGQEDALPKLSHLEYRESVIRSLANIPLHEDIPSAPVGKRKHQADDVVDVHPPCVAASTNRRNCVVCYRMHHIERKTRYYCRSCEIAPGNSVFVCLSEERNCWQIFHSHVFDEFR